ncbi:hypothetical protein CAC42_5214 [Sphaceloma murrayae]|uniref:CCA tRNA nucleotidyltransferase, mitochondrial n=1 Tax=Sphaceloma murrayae TaxID=2082308 RepID=A0A2K1QUE3_9PEZI|nr:hypothetical protein CAC42_5214 [Sphaceloma murrayae]
MPAHHAASGSRNFRDLEIKLTEVEDTLQRLLLDVVDFIQNGPIKTKVTSQVPLPPALASERTVLRFTGGWVRDKLLGVDSHDIDVAINNMTGEQFGLQMKDYLEQPGNAEKYGLEGVARTDAQSNKAGINGKSKLVGGLHKIEANPEKSKHLETITTRVLGLDIDLVNLRKETYTDDSRNPQIEFGTPEEDALRRDATINAMFYNLQTRQIEDFTGRGFDDMAARLIRTPLEPHQTFKDDPLRILRLIRFASRLGYLIDPEAAQSMTDDDIKAALRVKISRERVGVELEKMLRGPDPHRALVMINDAKLYTTVFSDPNPDAIQYNPDVQTWSMVLARMQALVAPDALGSLLEFDADDLYCAWNLVCMVPYRNAPQTEAPPGKKVPPPVATVVAREGFKATNKICDVVTASIRNAEDIRKTAASIQNNSKRPRLEDGVNLRESLGMAIRKWGPTWKLQAMFSLLCDIAEQPVETDALIANYQQFLQQVVDFGLEDAYNFRPLLDGKQLAKAIGINPGPWMKEALDVVMAWQLRDSQNTNVEEAIEQVKNSKVHGELKADLVKHFLQLTIRPLFAQNRPQGVTAQGRKDTRNMPSGPHGISLDEELMKPWKKREHQVFGILTWVTQQLDETLVEMHWHLVVPPILSMIDDHHVPYKARGCQLLTELLQRTPPTLLAKTGLFDVFANALMPCLGHLPTLTADGEAIDLLEHTFPALFALHDKAFKSSVIAVAGNSGKNSVIFLDQIMRKGILAIYSHCPEHAGILNVVLRNLRLVNDSLGLESMKHLRFTLPMLGEILCNPFETATLETLLLGTEALMGVMRNGWPLMSQCRAEVLKGLCVCWCNLVDAGDASEIQAVREKTREAVAMLADAAGAEIASDLEILLPADQRLEGLLVP